MLKKVIVLMIGALVAFCAIAYASEKPKVSRAEFEASIKYRKGEISLPGGIATLKIPDSFRYLGPEDSERVLVQAWGNPAGNNTLGMILPSSVSPLSKNGWGVIITYEEDGYVSDKDADGINYDDLLKDMKKGVAERNKERRKNGYETIELVGWAEKPSYDKATHKLYWAKELAFNGEKEHTLNYNIRVLGRKGVLVLNAVSDMKQISDVRTEMQQVLTFAEFNQGYRYADFDAKTDKVAAYGIAALVAGGVAAKAGLFTKLFAVVLAAKKVLFAGAIALIAGIGKLFGGKKKGEESVD